MATTSQETPQVIVQNRCVVCGNGLDLDGPGLYRCPICTMAAREGTTIEKIRKEVEESAGFWHHHLGQADGLRCTCGAGSGGEAIKLANGDVAHLDYPVKHKRKCALATGKFDWDPIDEEMRKEFGI